MQDRSGCDLAGGTRAGPDTEKFDSPGAARTHNYIKHRRSTTLHKGNETADLRSIDDEQEIVLVPLVVAYVQSMTQAGLGQHAVHMEERDVGHRRGVRQTHITAADDLPQPLHNIRDDVRTGWSTVTRPRPEEGVTSQNKTEDALHQLSELRRGPRHKELMHIHLQEHVRRRHDDAGHRGGEVLGCAPGGAWLLQKSWRRLTYHEPLKFMHFVSTRHESRSSMPLHLAILFARMKNSRRRRGTSSAPSPSNLE